jgi:hypothetical protein
MSRVGSPAKLKVAAMNDYGKNIQRCVDLKMIIIINKVIFYNI